MRIHPEESKNGKTKAKKQNFLLLIFYISIFLAVWALSCRQKAPVETDTNVPEPNTAAEITADNVAVTVNGVDITESEVEALIEQQFKQISAKTAQLPPEFADQYKKQLRQPLLEKLIIEQLMEEKVKEAGIVITEEDAIANLKNQLSQQQPSLSLEDFQARIEAQGQSFDELKQQLRKGLGYQKLLETKLVGKITVTEDDAEKYYSENQKKFEMPEQVRASHILIKPDTSDPNTDPNEAKAIAKAKAEDLLKQIKEGADFAELAKAHSDCPSAAKGGDLDYFSRNKMVPPFEEAAFELEPGQVSDIVETQFGFHIIKVTDRREAGVTPFEQVKTRIINELIRKKQEELFKEYIQSLKDEADIVYPPGKEPKSDKPALDSTEAENK